MEGFKNGNILRGLGEFFSYTKLTRIDDRKRPRYPIIEKFDLLLTTQTLQLFCYCIQGMNSLLYCMSIYMRNIFTELNCCI